MTRFLLITAIFLAGAAAVFLSSDEPESERFPREVIIGGESYALEIADTAEKRSKGLGERDEICQKCAMLFVFDQSGEQSFWMKGMRFPLDIVWLEGEIIVDIERNIPSDSQEIFTPSRAADRVLEFNALEMQQVKEGDAVRFVY